MYSQKIEKRKKKRGSKGKARQGQKRIKLTVFHEIWHSKHKAHTQDARQNHGILKEAEKIKPLSFFQIFLFAQRRDCQLDYIIRGQRRCGSGDFGAQVAPFVGRVREVYGYCLWCCDLRRSAIALDVYGKDGNGVGDVDPQGGKDVIAGVDVEEPFSFFQVGKDEAVV